MAEKLSEQGWCLFLALAKSCGGWVSMKDETGKMLAGGNGQLPTFIAGIDFKDGRGIAAELPFELWQFKHGLEVIERAKFNAHSVVEINSKLIDTFYSAAIMAEENKD